MKFVKLSAPRFIAGINRHPAEGPLPFADTVVDAIVADKGGVEVDEEGNEVDPELDDDAGDTDADGLAALTMPDLTIIVTNEGVPLNGVTKKADVIAAIRKHRNSPAA